MPATAAQLLGARAEEIALQYLQGCGLTTLERSFRRRRGQRQQTPAKRIIRAAQPLHRDYAALPVRFDVLMVEGAADAAPQVGWLRHAFDA